MKSEWLVGANGLYCGTPYTGWTQVGPTEFPVNAILNCRSHLVVGTEGGLWKIEDERWIQWHDETMTLVLSLAATDVGVGVCVASAYGVATGTLDDNNVPRWQWYSDGLKVNARFSNAILADPKGSGRWLVGTESGVWVCEGYGKLWTPSSLTDRPVRAMIWVHDAFWAGADWGGVWRSEDGVDWVPVGSGLNQVPVYALAWAHDRLVVGTEEGIAVGDGAGRWIFTGHALRVRSVGVSDSCWLSGRNPGGLWFSTDQGQTWQRTGNFNSVQTVVCREEA